MHFFDFKNPFPRIESIMSPWLLVITVLVILSIYFIVTRKETVEGLADFANIQNDFTVSQRAFFWDNPIPVNKETRFPSADLINQAFRHSESGISVNPDKAFDYSKLFKPEFNSDIDAKIKGCENITLPKNLPEDTTSKFRCGWWYISNPTVNSVSVFGSVEEPFNRASVQAKYPGGRWVWNKGEAIKLEEIKECKRVTNCLAIDGKNQSSTKNVNCAFCENLGYAIPVDAQGRPKYSDDETTCVDTFLKGTQGQCTIESMPSNIPAQCQNQPEGDPYTYDSNGNVTGVNPCAIAKGSLGNLVGGLAGGLSGGIAGSAGAAGGLAGGLGTAVGGLGGASGISSDSAALNAYASQNCIPVNGKLTRDCLKNLAKGQGLTEKGRILQLIISGQTILPDFGGLNELDKAAIKLLQSDGVNFTSNIFNGAITSTDAATIFANVLGKTTSTNAKVREAAKWLTIGTENFDICLYNDTDSGPYPLTCIQREFRKAGCQPSGLLHPNESNKSTYDSMTWGTLKQSFMSAYSKMTNHNNKFKDQDQAVRNCLGTDIYRSPVEVCNEYGIEYLVYKQIRPNSDDLRFEGRIISKSGWIMKLNQNGQLTPLGKLINNAIVLGWNPRIVVRTVKTPKNAESLKFSGWYAVSGGSYSRYSKLPWFLNGNQVPVNSYKFKGNEWQGIREIEEIENFKLIPAQPNEIEYRLEHKLTTKTEAVLPNIVSLNELTMKDYQLRQESWKPVIGFNYYKEEVYDANNIIKTNNIPGSMTFNTIGNRKALSLPGTSYEVTRNTTQNALLRNYNFVMQATEISSIYTITFMINPDTWVNNTQNNQNIIEFFGGGLQKFIISLNKVPNSDNFHINLFSSNYIIFNEARIRSDAIDNSNISTFLRIPPGQWSHITITHRGGRDFFFHINGKYVSQSPFTFERKFGKYAAYEPFQVDTFNTLLLAKNVRAKVAWIHFYDYVLNNDEILRDMNYDEPNYVMTPSATYVPPAHNPRCTNIRYQSYIKGTATPIRAIPAGQPLRTGQDPNLFTNITDPIGCCTACSTRPDCRAFIHNQGSGCRLFSALGPNATIESTNTEEFEKTGQGSGLSWSAAILPPV